MDIHTYGHTYGHVLIHTHICIYIYIARHDIDMYLYEFTCIYIYTRIYHFCIHNVYIYIQSVNVSQYHTLYSPQTRTK